MSVRRLTFVLGLALAVAAASASPPDDALAVVKRTLDSVLEIVNAGRGRDESLAELRVAARDILDTRAMGRRAMGDVLGAQPPERKGAYLELFDELIVRAYLQKLLLFRSPRFGYGRARRRGEVVIVPTGIVTTKDTYRVEYEMREDDGRWVATDVVVEGVSLTENYRAQFASLLRGRSFEELLDLMRAKTRPARRETTG